MIMEVSKISKLTEEEAADILGVEKDAPPAVIDRCYKRLANKTHPDLAHQGGAEFYQRVQDAYAVLTTRKHAPDGLRPARPENPRLRRFEGDATEYVSCWIDEQGVRKIFGGFADGEPVETLDRRERIDRVLSRRRITIDTLEADIVLDPRTKEAGFQRSQIRTALWKVCDINEQERRTAILGGLLDTLSPAEAEAARNEFTQIAEAYFDEPPNIVVATHQQYMWGVLRKALELPVHEPTVPVIYSRQQGNGKTLFGLWFLGALEDLRSPVTDIEEYLSGRSVDLLRYAAIMLDDVSAMRPHQYPRFNRLLSASEVTRPTRGGRGVQRVPVIAMPYATGNDVLALGQRRVVNLQFSPKGAELPDRPELAKLIWRSVDPYSDAPILSVRSELRRRQNMTPLEEVFMRWCVSFDVESEAADGIHAAHGFKARALCQLFQQQTGQTISENQFSTYMETHRSDPKVPFGEKVHSNAGAFYRLKS